MTEFSSTEVNFAQKLAANEKGIRHKALKHLRKWLRAKSSSKKGTFTKDDFLALWKGLHYCMWMQDKMLLQEEMSANLSKLVHEIRGEDSKLLFLRVFFETEVREWCTIDQWRLDKYMMLIRDMLHEALEVVKAAKFKPTVVSGFCSIMKEVVMQCPLGASPDGMKLHLVDIYLEEVQKIAGEPVVKKVMNNLLEPFMKYMQKGENHSVINRIVSKIFSPIIASNFEDENNNKSPMEEEEDDDEEDEDDKPEKQEDRHDITPHITVKFNFDTMEKEMFDLTASKACINKNRPIIIHLLQRLKDAMVGVIPKPEPITMNPLSDQDVEHSLGQLVKLVEPEFKTKKERQQFSKSLRREMKALAKKGKENLDMQELTEGGEQDFELDGVDLEGEESEMEEEEEVAIEEVVAESSKKRKRKKETHSQEDISPQKKHKKVESAEEQSEMVTDGQVKLDKDKISRKEKKKLKKKKRKDKKGKAAATDRTMSEALGLSGPDKSSETGRPLAVQLSEEVKKGQGFTNVSKKVDSSDMAASPSSSEVHTVLSINTNAVSKKKEKASKVQGMKLVKDVSEVRTVSSKKGAGGVTHPGKDGGQGEVTPKVSADKVCAKTTQPENDVEDGEVEIWVPNKKYKGNLKGGTPSVNSNGTKFANFQRTPVPSAFVNRATSKFTPKTPQATYQVPPELEENLTQSARRKRVSFDLKQNRSVVKDCLAMDTKFNPEKKPEQGILKSPSPAVTRSMHLKGSSKKRALSLSTPILLGAKNKLKAAKAKSATKVKKSSRLSFYL